MEAMIHALSQTDAMKVVLTRLTVCGRMYQVDLQTS